jgi:hypothetical protein
VSERTITLQGTRELGTTMQKKKGLGVGIGRPLVYKVQVIAIHVRAEVGKVVQ